MRVGTAALLIVVGLGACKPARQTHHPDNGMVIVGQEPPPPPGTPPLPSPPTPWQPPANGAFPPAPGTPGGLPDDRMPNAEHARDDDGARAAYAVVERYYAALEGHDAATALAQWRDPVAGKRAVAVAITAPIYHASIGSAGRVEAGAGQRHVSFPVQPYGVDATGRNFAQLGTITLHRTADIDGTTPDQRTWRIVAIELKRTR